MSSKRALLRLVGGFGAILLVTGAVTPVGAAPAASAVDEPPPEPVPGTKFSDKSVYQSLSTYWTQVDTRPDGTPVPPDTAPFGNVHVGFMDVYHYTGESVTKVPGQRKDRQTYDELFAYAQILDFDCPVGVLPPTGGGHGEGPVIDVADPAAVRPAELEQAVADVVAQLAVVEPPAGECVHIGVRTGQQDGLTIEIDRNLGTATAKGFLLMYAGGDPHSGEPGQVVGRPPVNAVWTGIGDVGTGESSGSYRRGSERWSYEGSSRDREATMSGILGPMGFAPGLSGGYMSVGENSSKQQF